MDDLIHLSKTLCANHWIAALSGNKKAAEAYARDRDTVQEMIDNAERNQK